MRLFVTLTLTVLVALNAQAEKAPSFTPSAPITQDSIAPEQALYDTLLILDSVLFDAAFNTCNLELLTSLLTEDLEFYHDKGGQVAQSREDFINNIRQGCERKEAGTDIVAKRVLDKASVKIYLMNNYGAIQMGTHRFYEVREGQEDLLREEALFTHLWQYKDGAWRISRVLSYDHQWKGE